MLNLRSDFSHLYSSCCGTHQQPGKGILGGVAADQLFAAELEKLFLHGSCMIGIQIQSANSAAPKIELMKALHIAGPDKNSCSGFAQCVCGVFPPPSHIVTCDTKSRKIDLAHLQDLLNLEGAWGQNGQQWSLKSPITSPLPVCNGYSWLHHGKAESNLHLNPPMRKVAVTRHVLDKAGPWIQREACSNLRIL